MAEERRSAPRARISGVRVTYEAATGDHVETDALNLGRGGLFVRAAKPLAVGKRLTLEIQVAGELVPWSALGRVVWTRHQDEGERSPPGMGVKLIDVEDAVEAAIEQLVARREDRGLAVAQVPAAATIASMAPSRERTILGVGSPAEDEPTAPQEPVLPREPSIAIDLVATDATFGSSPPRDERWNQATAPIADDAELALDAPSDVRRGGGARWIVVLILLIAAAAAAYAVLDGDLDRVLRPSEPVPATPTLPIQPVPVSPPTAMSAAPTSPPSVTTAGSLASTTTTTVSAPTPPPLGVPAPRKLQGASPAPSIAHPPAAKKPPTEENNPY